VFAVSSSRFSVGQGGFRKLKGSCWLGEGARSSRPCRKKGEECRRLDTEGCSASTLGMDDFGKGCGKKIHKKGQRSTSSRISEKNGFALLEEDLDRRGRGKKLNMRKNSYQKGKGGGGFFCLT